MIQVRNKILPEALISVGKPSLFMDKSFLESLTNDEHKLLSQRYAVIHTVTLSQEIQRNTIEERGENQPNYISLTKKMNETQFRNQEHYLTLMKKELLGHAVILNRGHGVPYLVLFDRPIQQLNWQDGNLSEADKEKAAELMENARLRAVDVGTEYFMGFDLNLAHYLKNNLQCISKKNVSLAGLKLEITDKLKNHLFSAEPVLRELWSAFVSSNEFKKAGKQAPGTVTTFEILEDELASIERNWGYIRANIQTEFPYTYYYLVVNAFLNIGIPNSRIREQLRLKADDNLSDLQYLYYLPFCNVFVSSDRFHKAVVPEFLTDQQDFIWGPDLKEIINDHEPSASASEYFIIYPNFP